MLVSESTKRGLTVAQIAEEAKVSLRTVRSKRQLLLKYEIEKEATGARPRKMYHPAVLSIFGTSLQSQSASTPSRQPRSDKGKPRGRNEELVNELTRRTLSVLLSMGQYDVREASRRVLRKARRDIRSGKLNFKIEDLDKIEQSEWFYRKWLVRKDEHNQGVAHKQNWLAKWQYEYKQWTKAVTVPTLKHNFWRIIEHDYDCGPGRGFARHIFLDDRKSDAYIDTPDGPRMKYAVYAFCVLTGAMLHVEPADTVTTQTYVRTILTLALRYGWDAPVFYMENAKAAKNKRLTSLIEKLYTTDQWNELYNNEAHRKLFHSEIVIHRNVPHIPRDLGKGAGERFFKEVKRFDAIAYPRAFQGGNRQEAVELQRAKLIRPRTEDIANEFDYYHNMLAWGWSDYIDMSRDNLKEWSREKGLPPTNRARIDYYMPEQRVMPSERGFIEALYFAHTDHVVRKLGRVGALKCQIDNRAYNLQCTALHDPTLKGQPIAIVANPFDDTGKEYALFLPKENGKYLGMATDMTTNTLDEVFTLQKKARAMREYDKAKHQREVEEALSTLPDEWQPAALIAEQQNLRQMPSLPHDIDPEEEPELLETVAVEIIEDDETASEIADAIEIEQPQAAAVEYQVEEVETEEGNDEKTNLNNRFTQFMGDDDYDDDDDTGDLLEHALDL